MAENSGLAPSFALAGQVLSQRPSSVDPTMFSKKLGQKLLDAAEEHSEVIPEGLYLTLANLAKEQFECVPFVKYRKACEALGAAAYAIKACEEHSENQESLIKAQEKTIKSADVINKNQKEVINDQKLLIAQKQKLLKAKDELIEEQKKISNKKTALFKDFAEANGYDFEEAFALPPSLLQVMEVMCPPAKYELRKRKREKR